MLYIYDNALVDDLTRSFNPMSVPDPVVKVVASDSIVQIAAQIQDDHLSFPLVAVLRDENIQIDQTRTNFTQMHRGVSTVFDNEHNEYYHEKAIPVELNYSLNVLATNTADLDEIVRELLFKYTSMYFLTTRLPYEGDRKVRFGVTIDKNGSITRNSGTFEYIESGTLYEAAIPLKCEGCVLVHYTPVKLERTKFEQQVVSKGEKVE